MNSSRYVECEINIEQPSSLIIEAFVSPEKLKGWWGVEKTCIRLTPGGVYTLAWGVSDQGMKYISTGIIADYNPSYHLHIVNLMYLSPDRSFLGPMELEMTCSPTEKGSTLHLKQGPYPENSEPDWEWYYAAVTQAWPAVLKTLKDYLEKTEG